MKNELPALKDLQELQKAFQNRIEQEGSGAKEEQIGSMEFMRLHTLALQVEIGEALQELPWKPWKKNQKLNSHAFKKELADCQIFLWNLQHGIGLSEKGMRKLISEKIGINHNRQDNGY